VKEIVFALEFAGHAGPVPGSPTERRARTSASSQAWHTSLGPDGVEARLDPLAGGRAVLESRVERFGDGTFTEDGTIQYGGAGSIAFITVGRGTVGLSPIDGRQVGGVIWAVTGGDGRFAGARGVITSNFTVDSEGRVVDHHIARLYLPT